jgi:hypothetical protein
MADQAVASGPAAGGGIDRGVLVRRHNPTIRRVDPFAALSVGNGTFAFTADVTGLQTFAEAYRTQFPLCTVAHWGWHTAPPPAGIRREDFRFKPYDAHGRQVGYATDPAGQESLFHWLRQNPHRLHLGRIAFELKKAGGSPATPADLTDIQQTLDLWTGILDSRFVLEGLPVHVQSCCHDDLDLLAVRVESPLLGDGRLRVRLAFPYASPDVAMADWTSGDRHRTECQIQGRRADLARTLDDDRYHVRLGWSEGTFEPRARHEFLLTGPASGRVEFVCLFSAEPQRGELPGVAEALEASAARWRTFWGEGGVLDLSGSTDARAGELERRVVLSQYNTAVHCAGAMPSQETGLLFNSWYGKSHLEMHWWHAVHFAAWDRFALFERGLDYYPRILPVAREIARRQGYRGARWPKMVGPDGHDAPSAVGPLLIWQQPHPIYYAELCYRRRPGGATLERWRPVVFETAEFLASYAAPEGNRFVLGPPLKTVSENADPLVTTNPTFELAYWRFGLRVAQAWRERLGLGREAQWDEVLSRLAPLPQQDGLYLMQEGMADTYTTWNWEHPALLGAYGMQLGDGIDPETMRRSLRKVMEVWQWDRCWGWDFPMAAMTAARLGESELAVKALLIDSPKNRYLPNGHVYQRPGLTAYLPANGGLLAAVAMMARGTDARPARVPPGFPANGRWQVRYEGLGPLL